MAGLFFFQGRGLAAAYVVCPVAPRMKAAARGRLDKVRHCAGDGTKRIAIAVEPRAGSNESAGVRVPWGSDQASDIRVLNDLARVHDCSIGTDPGQNSKIMGNKKE